MLSEREVEEIIQAEKSIGEAISWSFEKSRKPRARFQVTVACEGAVKALRLVGFVGPVNFSYSLLTLQGQTLRRLNRHLGGHPNPGGEPTGERHKHYWTDEDEDRRSYVPTDIDWTDRNQALLDFLEECNITPLSEIDKVGLQKELPR